MAAEAKRINCCLTISILNILFYVSSFMAEKSYIKNYSAVINGRIVKLSGLVNNGVFHLFIFL